MAFLRPKYAFDPIKDVPDLTGKVVVVTGATAGIGLALTEHLARKGAKVYLAARNESKATGVIAQIEAELAKDGVKLVPASGQLEWARLDLDDPKEAGRAGKALAERLKTKEGRLDILVNNAATASADHELTPLGILKIMTVNHFSPAAFTQTLLPILKTTSALPDADVRIVNFASGAYKSTPANARLATVEDCNQPHKNSFMVNYKRYVLSKLANIWYTKSLQRHLAESSDGKNILCVSLHPGVILSQTITDYIGAYSWPFRQILFFLAHLFLRPTSEGAYNALFLATSPTLRASANSGLSGSSSDPSLSAADDKYAGAYFEPVGKLGALSEAAGDETRAEELWVLTQKLLAEWGCS